MELRYNLEGHQLGIVSVDINYLGTSEFTPQFIGELKKS